MGEREWQKGGATETEIDEIETEVEIEGDSRFAAGVLQLSTVTNGWRLPADQPLRCKCTPSVSFADSSPKGEAKFLVAPSVVGLADGN